MPSLAALASSLRALIQNSGAGVDSATRQSPSPISVSSRAGSSACTCHTANALAGLANFSFLLIWGRFHVLTAPCIRVVAPHPTRLHARNILLLSVIVFGRRSARRIVRDGEERAAIAMQGPSIKLRRSEYIKPDSELRALGFRQTSALLDTSASLAARAPAFLHSILYTRPSRAPLPVARPYKDSGCPPRTDATNIR